MAGAGIAGGLAGFLKVEGRWATFKIAATGALAVFIILYLINPPPPPASTSPALPTKVP